MQQQQPNQPSAAAQSAATQPEATDTGVARPVQTARSGAVGASIWQNNNDNFGITLSRSWKSKDGETGHSKTFYAGNRDDLHKAIDQACDIAQALERSVAQRIEQLGSDLTK